MTKMNLEMAIRDSAGDQDARNELKANQTPVEKRYSNSMMERMLHFLEVGYKVREYNAFQPNGLYKTVLVHQATEQPFIYDHSLNFTLTPGKEEEILTRELRNLLNKKET